MLSTQESQDRQELERRHDAVVREEIEIFRQRADDFLAGRITEDEFRPFRLKHGIYGQRQPGVQMVRVKIPSGMLTARQLEQLALVGGRVRWQPRAPDHAAEHAVSLRPAGQGG